jgi:hypothetical protein
MRTPFTARTIITARTIFTARTIAAAGLGTALALGSTTVATAMPARDIVVGMPSAPTAAPMAQDYYWDWSDGSDATTRTFKKSKYHTQARLPHLMARADPATPSHMVYLKFKENGKWVLETKKRTNGKGEASMDLNPYCKNNSWCDGTWTYRLSIGSSIQTFRITYSRK